MLSIPPKSSGYAEISSHLAFLCRVFLQSWCKAISATDAVIELLSRRPEKGVSAEGVAHALPKARDWHASEGGRRPTDQHPYGLAGRHAACRTENLEGPQGNNGINQIIPKVLISIYCLIVWYLPKAESRMISSRSVINGDLRPAVRFKLCEAETEAEIRHSSFS